MRDAAADLEFANDVLTPAGEAVDKAAPKKLRAEAAAEKAEAFRKGGESNAPHSVIGGLIS